MNDNDNELCEICMSNFDKTDWMWRSDFYVINEHCIELRQNRVARENKNIKPKNSVF